MRKIIAIIALCAAATFASNHCMQYAETIIASLEQCHATEQTGSWICGDIHDKDHGRIISSVSYNHYGFSVMSTYIPSIDEKRLGYRSRFIQSFTIFTDFCSLETHANRGNPLYENHNQPSLARYYKNTFIEEKIK